MSTATEPSTEKAFEELLNNSFYDLKSLANMVLENRRTIAEELNVSPEDFQRWMESQSGIDTLNRVREHLNHFLDSALTRIIERCISHLDDRLQNGDIRSDKHRNMYRQPINAISLSKIFSAIFDRRQLLRDQPTTIQSEQGSLDQLAENLKAVSARNTVTVHSSMTHLEQESCPDRA